MNIAWSLTKIKILGVYIGHGDLAEANWCPCVDAVRRCLKSWRSRSLSFSGKALLANSLALSRVWYVASLVHMPAWVFFLVFFWSGKRDLVARKVLIHPEESGGFSVVSIDFKVEALYPVGSRPCCLPQRVGVSPYLLVVGQTRCHSFRLFL